MNGANAIAENVLGPIDWRDSQTGYCRCPGKDCHTTRDGRRDAIVHLDGAPTISCFHQHCQAAVQQANGALRQALRGGSFKPPTLYHIQRQQARKDKQAQIRREAQESLAGILADFEWAPVDMFDGSPVTLSDDPREDWWMLLSHLFTPEAVVWIGDVRDSCPDEAPENRKAECRRHFRPVAEWLTETEAPGQFTCPSVFKNSIHSRSNANVLAARFLVVESDTLAKEQIGAVFNWLSQFLPLRAIVDTAGKSLHGWFERPPPEHERELRVILPEMGCDPALFKLSQPCRLPGAERGASYQRLLYLSKEATIEAVRLPA